MRMKRLFFYCLLTLSCATAGVSQTSAYLAEGMCGDYLYYSIDEDYHLAFWLNEVGGTEYIAGSVYTMWAFGAPDDMTAMPAPWSEYAAQIESIDLTYVPNIGSNAFRDMVKLHSLTLYNVEYIGDSAFLGSTNLTTLRIQSYQAPPGLMPASLLLDKTSGKEVSLVLVPTENVIQYYKRDTLWTAAGRVITTENGEWNETEWTVAPSVSGEGTVSLTLDYTPADPDDPTDLLFIGDMDTSVVTPPWHSLRDKVEDLVIGDKVSYIGKDAFASLTNVQSVQFRQDGHALDSIHIDAFAHTIRPWKFALGDPQDGPVVPPAIIGWDGDTNSLPQNFLDETVLYVPDSMFEYKGDTVRAIDLYRNDPFWSRFNRITDRTVDVGETTEQSVQMAWLPLEGAVGYNLTIHKTGCAECDTTIFIPATGDKGLLDWEHIDSSYTSAPRRKPKSDDGNGGMTILIEIKKGSGSAPNNDVQVSASGLEAASEYSYTREVVMDNYDHSNVNAALTKGGSFVTQKSIVYYTVTFVDKDGNILKTETVEEGYGATAPDDELIPDVEGHTFTGWDKAFEVVESDLTVTAQYEINVYTVTFVNWDGKVVYTQTVSWGSSADTPAGPSREGYTFTGWDKDYSSVKEDMVITAQFTILTFTVTFFDRNGKELTSQTVEWHGKATAPDAPTEEGYHFTGWDADFSDVTTNLLVMAQYAINTYTVTFVDFDGTVISTQTVEWMGAAKYPDDPKREGYTFVKWDNPIDNVTSDITVTAQYAINTYTVTFKDWDERVLDTQEVEHGSAATAPEDPEREGYTFTGWDKTFDVVESDLTVTAQYEQNDPTGLDDVQKDDVPCTKVLRDGRVVILVGGQEFDAQGKKIL